jgi:hypothetical protein
MGWETTLTYSLLSHPNAKLNLIGQIIYESCRDVSDVNVRHNISVCEIVSGCAIFVMKNLTQTERSHLCALFHPQTLS